MKYIIATSKEHIVPIKGIKKIRLRIHDDVLLAGVREHKNHFEWSFRSELDAQKAMIAFCNSRIATVRRVR